MGQTEKTTTELTKGQKEALKDLQVHFKSEFGTKPTQGETIAIAAERIMGGSA